MLRIVGTGVVLTLVLSGCRSDDQPADARSEAVTGNAEQQYPDVIDVVAEEESGGVFAFRVTVSSPYDTPGRYADGWRIIGPDRTVYGEHTLAHDHADEQPFTRTQRGIEIPAGVDEVTVEGRDSEYGYGGETITVALDR